MICHSVLVKKLKVVDIPDAIVNSTINFLTDRTECMTNGKKSSRLSKSRSIVKGYGLESHLFFIYALIIRAKSLRNVVC